MNGEIKCTFVARYPEILHALVRDHSNSLKVIKSRAEDIDLSDISSFGLNDIVFIVVRGESPER